MHFDDSFFDDDSAFGSRVLRVTSPCSDVSSLYSHTTITTMATTQSRVTPLERMRDRKGRPDALSPIYAREERYDGGESPRVTSLNARYGAQSKAKKAHLKKSRFDALSPLSFDEVPEGDEEVSETPQNEYYSLASSKGKISISSSRVVNCWDGIRRWLFSLKTMVFGPNLLFSLISSQSETQFTRLWLQE